MRVNFPHAKLHASTFEAFLEAVQPVIDQLPVVEGEIGDTWISGIASDPKKMAEYRVVSDTLTDCIKNGMTYNVRRHISHLTTNLAFHGAEIAQDNVSIA